MEKKIIYFDIDGTLINCHTNLVTMSDKTLYSLDSLKKAGHQIFIASGRCLCFMPRVIQDYPFDGYIGCNGASIHYKEEKIHQDLISLKQLQRLETFSKKYNTVYFLEEDHIIYTNGLNRSICQEFIKKWEMPKTNLKAIDSIENLNVQMAMMVFPNPEVLTLAQNYFKDDFDLHIHPHQLSSDFSLKTSSKGKAIQFVSEHLNMDIKNTIAFGDGPNDVEMFNTVELPLAMGNAVDELKEIAKDVLLSVDEDGIYFGLVKHQLIKEI